MYYFNMVSGTQICTRCYMSVKIRLLAQLKRSDEQLLFHFIFLDVASYSHLSRSIWIFILSNKLCSFQNFFIFHRFYKLALRKLYLHVKNVESTKLRTELMKYLFLGWFNHYIAQIKISYYWWMDCLHYKNFLKITHYTLKNTFPLGNSVHFEIVSNCFSWTGRCWSCPTKIFGL